MTGNKCGQLIFAAKGAHMVSLLCELLDDVGAEEPGTAGDEYFS
jgi:hypothetical protein